MPIPKTLPWKFKVFADRTHYWEVRVFKTKKDMHAYVKDHGGFAGGYNFAAITRGQDLYKITKGKKDKLVKEYLGEMLFTWQSLRSGVVAHEAVHGAMFYMERLGHHSIPTTVTGTARRDLQERTCYAAGYIVQQIWRGYYRRMKKK